MLPSRTLLSTRLSPLQTSDKALTDSSLFSASLTQHGQLSRISSLPLPPLRSSRRLPILASHSSSLLASFRCTRVCLRISLKLSRGPSLPALKCQLINSDCSMTGGILLNTHLDKIGNSRIPSTPSLRESLSTKPSSTTRTSQLASTPSSQLTLKPPSR